MLTSRFKKIEHRAWGRTGIPIASRMNAEVLELPTVAAASPEHVLCAVRLRAPENVERVPTHFILLLDVSSSMEDDNKLENCKKCVSLILNVLSERDLLTLITFGDSADTVSYTHLTLPTKRIV